MQPIIVAVAFVLLITACSPAAVQALPMVEKQEFVTHNFTTFGGEVIPEVRVGWEAYGELNDAKDNVILVTHFFSGNSHAAGRYSEDDAQPGYWDAIIGPGKAIDTNIYYVISVDTLVNQEPYNPNVITTGPSTINPETGAPYGLDFPVVTIRDFVNVQKTVLESLGIERLHAVIGASMGSLQALDWAAAYPDQVDRMISVIGMGAADPWTIATLQQWANPIIHDPNWNQGNYYDGEPPLAGMQQTLGMITLTAMHPLIINQLYADSSPREAAPLQDIRNNFSVVERLQDAARVRATYADANHILYLVRANQLFMAGYQDDLATGLQDVQARSLFIPASNDLLLQPYLAKQAHNTLIELGKDSQYVELEGPWGHLDGVFEISQKADLIKEFLNN
ncbi:homoserine O-acetyltransferase [Aliidiomarina halalkaliphila]|uniref:Probable acyltransferase n=2 Tax=Aliidiomarina halalkaliphila TaxID=2593535 RepID=A0A552X0F5_9GAMM|nr:homoserine O-acetyltransferase [Aliidiomarina halalkaliphila]TRW48538.1 homoserine O-acetyltransferase [Aliidiomarina halalkaliphila]